MKPIVDEYRKGVNLPSFYKNFEYLYDEAKRLYPDMKKNQEWSNYSQAKVAKYLQDHPNRSPKR